MIILGINAYHADSSAAIFVNGKMIAATEEERFRRVKHWAGFPSKAVEFCLEEAGVTLDEVDHIAIGRDPNAKFLRKMLFVAKKPLGSLAMIKNRFGNAKKVANVHEDLEKLREELSRKSQKAQKIISPNNKEIASAEPRNDGTSGGPSVVDPAKGAHSFGMTSADRGIASAEPRNDETSGGPSVVDPAGGAHSLGMTSADRWIASAEPRNDGSSGMTSQKGEIASPKGRDGAAEPRNDGPSKMTSLRKKVHQVEHHRSHLASAFFASPYEEAALLSIDGSGDFTTTMIGVGRGNKIEVLDSVDFPHSMGIFYTAFTQLLGFPHYGDEYKVMGLAPYGNPQYVDKLKDVIKLDNKNGLFKLNLDYFRPASKGYIFYGDDHIPQAPTIYGEKMTAVFGKPREKQEPLTQYHKDLAASVQRMTEEVIFHILTHLHKRTGLTRVCIAGGVAQNSVANGKITRNTPFKEVYIPSAGHDAGISMGAALYVQHQVLDMPRQPIWSAYTGSAFGNEEIEKLLTNRSIAFKRLSDEELYEAVSDRLVDAGVVGWFSGRAEFGPRALGGRSILADPRRSDAKDLLNAKIKRRESFRPFAPSILKEYVDEYFEVNDVVPFMEKVFPIRKEKHATIPAVTHADGTGRLQTVDKEVSPRYYKLIDKFREKTGVPILLNTSFNENEPIVNSPIEALECFLRTNMDMLVLENCVIER